ncbi:hypothetical protein J4460_05790 [Candidatus Woesearchaeota archaeon]|nr:hypothetical protein [Candidatus Woesearchaeota archaeon]HIH38990.1 hypothetical protein [Candidatus Woesearchaeota archaeon]HIH48799.1 hypothetical protein [Candidatus Woesearchaeota archaeon]HIJ04092.1 hypothetical protein [Candidatus Woesearchaeota archaeon]
MAKCSLCNQGIETTFLGKALGTTIRKSGKVYKVCSQCQKKFSHEDLLEKL